jgi:hypothetical protein
MAGAVMAKPVEVAHLTGSMHDRTGPGGVMALESVRFVKARAATPRRHVA